MNLEIIRHRAKILSKSKDPASLARAMGFYYLGHGISRQVFLDQKNLVVYKIAFGDDGLSEEANFTEMTVWKALPDRIKNLFAECFHLSKNRKVLVAEYVDFTLTLFDHHHPINQRVERFIDRSNISDFIADLCEPNMAVNINGYCKIIDYGILGCAKTLTNMKAIKTMARYKAVRFANRFKRKYSIKFPVDLIKDHIPPFCMEE
jgi:hypothetical protein